MRLEDKYYIKSKKIRGIIFTPIVKIFSLLKITPNMLSAAGIVTMIFFVAFIEESLFIAVILLFLAIIFDLLDGPLARYLRSDSDKGKFIDMVCDNLVFSIFIIGLVLAGFLSGLLGTLLIYAMLLSKIFRIVEKGHNTKSDWLFKTSAGFFPNFFVGLMYFGFFLLYFWKLNYFYYMAGTAIIALFLDSFRYFYKIISLKLKNDF